jgi:PD-(D/E)XK nuclease superfamily domain
MTNSNKHGTAAELIIGAMLRTARCEYTTQVDVGRSIYGTTIRADFVLHNLIEFPGGLVLESKWQDSEGTADEKFPYLVANIHGAGYGYPVVVVLGGNGYKPGAVVWIRQQVDGRRLLAVFSWEELQSWLLRNVHVRERSPKFL